MYILVICSLIPKQKSHLKKAVKVVVTSARRQRKTIESKDVVTRKLNTIRGFMAFVLCRQLTTLKELSAVGEDFFDTHLRIYDLENYLPLISGFSTGGGGGGGIYMIFSVNSSSQLKSAVRHSSTTKKGEIRCSIFEI